MTRLEKKKTALICLKCETVLVSWSRHDFCQCPCLNGAFIDGGDDYNRIGANNMSEVQLVELDPGKPKRKKK